MITVRVDVSKTLARFRKAGPQGRVHLVEFMRKHGRALISSSGKTPGIVQLTPPFSKGKRGALAKKQGEQAITNDLLGKGRTGQRSGGAFVVMSDTLLANAHFNKTENVRIFARKNGDVYGTDRRHFRPKASTSEMHAHHQSLRGRNGRVIKAGGFTRDIGRWKFIDQMVVGVAAFKRYQKTVHAKVGIMASAIVGPAELAMGGVLAGIPAWVRRHVGKASGGLVAFQKETNGITVAVALTDSRVPADMQRRMNSAATYRTNAMRSDLPRTAARMEKALQIGL